MRVFVGLITWAAAVAVVVATSIFCQWLSWHGPEWVLEELSNGEEVLGLGVLISAFAIDAFACGAALCISCNLATN